MHHGLLERTCSPETDGVGDRLARLGSLGSIEGGIVAQQDMAEPVGLVGGDTPLFPV